MNLVLDEITVRNLVFATAIHLKRLEKLERFLVNQKLAGDPEFVSFDCLNAICDIFGVPRDNCSEFDSLDPWPPGAYCRDWVYDAWCESETAGDFIDTLVKGMEDYHAQ